MDKYRITLGTYETDILPFECEEDAIGVADGMASDKSMDTQQDWFVADIEKVEEE